MYGTCIDDLCIYILIAMIIIYIIYIINIYIICIIYIIIYTRRGQTLSLVSGEVHCCQPFCNVLFCV